MEIRDKIYACVEEKHDDVAVSDFPFRNGNIEFIRKEALIEWLLFKKDITDNKTIRETIEEVIDKLNHF